MPDIDALKTRFFVNVGDVVQAGDSPTDPDVAITALTRPQTDGSSRTTHLIDGANYFGAIKAEVAALTAGGTDRFFYTNSWHLGTAVPPTAVSIGEGSFTKAWQQQAFAPNGPPFQLQDGTSGPFHPFSQDLTKMADVGVDVRLLVWASPFLVNFAEASQASNALKAYWAFNVHSLKSVLELRAADKLKTRVVLNTLAHTLGAMHLKMVVCGDSAGFRAYVAGLHFVQNRNARPTHPDIYDDPDHPTDYWHDVGMRVEGSAANGLYHYFQQLWNEQVKRSAKTFRAYGKEIPTVVDDTPLVQDRTTPGVAAKQHTQILRTVPTMNFAFFGNDRIPVNCFKRIVSGFKQSSISFAEDGIFEFRAAQRKAVDAALRYIYIEDQAMQNLELGTWINKRLKDVAALKVILLYMNDPTDAASPFLASFMDNLINGLPSPQERIVFAVAPYTVHSKLTIIDDLWASVGSSNSMRRSFYMDGEISVSVLDEDSPTFAAKLRKDLWGEHCGLIPGPMCDDLLDLDQALGIWRESWVPPGTPPPALGLRLDIKRKKIPFVYVDVPTPTPISDEDFRGHRLIGTEINRDQQDGDSRLEY